MLWEKANKFKHFLLAWIAYWRYGRPARKLVVVGVTGTKGKSTTCRLIASVLEAGGFKVGLLSTVEFQIGEKRWLNDKKMTMLGRGQIQKMLKEIVDAGCQYAVVETSSEGILQYRHYGLCYDVAVFTNLGTEHSERHGGFENLKQDKGILFAALEKCQKNIGGKKIPKVIVANLDDDNAGFYLDYKADEKIGFGIMNQNFKDKINKVVFGVCAPVSNTPEFTVEKQNYLIHLPGQFNVYNALAAVAVGKSQNIKDTDMAVGLEKVHVVPGRMEFIDGGQKFKFLVDYAHEPMSLVELFKTLRQMAGENGKVIGIVGSDGGGRDKGKRTKMGEIAGKMCDTVIVTDVNCFDEDPREIAEMLAKGARSAGKKDNQDLFVEIDRRKAIELAISVAKPGDIVVLTAKGTEPCIVVAGGKKIPWDDRTVSREILLSLKH